MGLDSIVMDEFHGETRTDPFTLLGKAVSVRPEDQATVFDITTKMGGCSNLYYSLVFWLPKLDYRIAKVDETMEVAPTHIDAYNLTIAQKQKLEGAIKTGLASAAQAIADYELLAHDQRRYQEVWDYFKKGRKDDHVLRSLFVDRIDAYTGEGFSMVTMTKRWPTIITDFIRLSKLNSEKITKDKKGNSMEKEMSIDEIKNELDVTQAEATVLKTKNELYNEWKKLFLPTVKNRLARIENMVNSREKSAEEYKNWLKPYIARYKLMREATEANPSAWVNDYVMTPGFSQAVAFSTVRLWAWRPMIIDEKDKPAYETFSKKSEWMIDPYDDLVKEWAPKIEKHYEFTKGYIDENIEKIKEGALGTYESPSFQRVYQYEFSRPQMDPRFLYYQMYDITFMRSIIKTAPPEGSELENVMIMPLENWIISQNVMLLHIIELWARKKHFDRYVEQIVGSKNLEDQIRERLDEEYEGKEGKKEKKEPNKFAKTLSKSVKNFGSLFVKPGPYESNFFERITKLYLVKSGQEYGVVINFIKDNIGA